ncbi:MAG: DNA polymerase III subunit beta [Nitrospirae bacterium]|nr:DNA polymerase III subunit beta [Nitrospirota bacterium]
MQFEITPTSFLTASAFVAGLCKGRTSSMPVLKNMLIQSAGPDRLEIAATNIETFAKVSAPATVGAEGSLCVPGDLIIDMMREGKQLKSLTMKALEKGHARVHLGDAEYQIVGIDPNDYPKMEAALGDTPTAKAALQGEALTTLLKRILHSAPQDACNSGRGILLEFEKGHIRATTTDGHRLASATAEAVVEIQPGPEGAQNIILSTESARKLAELGGATIGWVEIVVGKTALKATAEGKDGLKVTVGTRLIEGTFPKWRDVVRKTHTTTVTVERNHLKSGLERASILAGPLTQGARMEFTEKGLEVTLKNPDAGEMRESLAAWQTGPDTAITANVAYLLDALGGVTNDQVQIALAGPEGAVDIRNAGDTQVGYVALVMPMRQ